MGHFGVKMKRSRDGGATWEERPVPQFPPKPDDVVDLDPMRNTPIPWDTKRVWALEGSQRAGELWCGTIPGGLFHSRDGGDSWQLVESLWSHPDRKFWVGGGADYPGIHSILVDPRNPDVVRLGVSCGGLWLSTDGGESWDCKGQGMRADYAPPDQAYERRGQDAHRLAQCAAAPDHIWIQHHNGIFRSTDGGLTCTEITNAQPSVFGFPVVVHPAEPRTAWFVPGTKDQWRYPVDGALVVSRTTRRRRELRGAARRLAAAARVRRRLSPRARHRCRWRYTRVRQHHRQSIRQRKLGRALAKRQPLPAADLLRSIRELSVARKPARNA